MNFQEASENYASDLLLHKLHPKYTFHGLFHTTQVVEKAVELAGEEKLSPDELEVLLLAAWFHDTGYIHDPRNHEGTSCVIAAEHLLRPRAGEELIKKVCLTILGTRMPQSPSNKLEAILCDADLHHLGYVDYKIWNKMLCKEVCGEGTDINQVGWLQGNYCLF